MVAHSKQMLLKQVQQKVFDIVEHTHQINSSTMEIIELFRQLEREYKQI